MKLAGFSLSTEVQEAQQALENREVARLDRYGRRGGDVWAIGVLAYELISGTELPSGEKAGESSVEGRVSSVHMEACCDLHSHQGPFKLP